MSEKSQNANIEFGFMSRVTCAAHLGQAWQLRTPYEQHRTLWRLFADHDGRDFLFHEEIPRRRSAGLPRRFLVVSARRPSASGGLTVETRDYAPQLAEGDQLRFSLRLSVTSARPVERPATTGAPLRGRGKTVDPVADALATVERAVERHTLRRQWLLGDSTGLPSLHEAPLLVTQWLAPKLLRHGLSVDTEATRVVSYEPAMHQGRKSKDTITFSAADFSGVVGVADAKLAARAAFTGIGRGKSLGYGLLLFSRRDTSGVMPRSEMDDDEEEAPTRP